MKSTQEHHVAQIVLGESSRSRLEEFLHGDILAILRDQPASGRLPKHYDSRTPSAESAQSSG